MAFSPQLEYMAKDFNKFMSQLQETNQTLDFFCDFDKISRNVEDIKLPQFGIRIVHKKVGSLTNILYLYR